MIFAIIPNYILRSWGYNYEIRHIYINYDIYVLIEPTILLWAMATGAPPIYTTATQP